MNYCSRTRQESKLLEPDGTALKYPGVSFVINRMNERRRVQRELDLAELRQKVNEQQAELRKAIEDKDNLPAGQVDKLNAAFGNLLHSEWYPAWIRWGLASIDGLDIDGEKATLATLCEAGPSDLVEEIFNAVLAAAGLSTVQEKNLPPPGASDIQADGKTSDSIATGATPPESGNSETAPSSTPAT